MLRSLFSFFMFLVISILSFFLTSLSIKYIKELDPLMILIKENKKLYEVASVNATIDDINIIPGIKGVGVDIDASYELMKNYGSYNANLLVFYDVIPSVSISNIYNRYVVSGNKDKKEVALIFKVEDTDYLEEIVYILKDKDVIGTFFLSEKVFLESVDVIKLLYLNKQKIELLGTNKGYSLIEIDRVNSLVKRYIDKDINYCYSDEVNKDILKVCSSRKMHTIVPSINTLNYPYYDIKNKLDNGSIIKFNNNSMVVDELKYIINYIRQKDYKIVSLEKLLEE